MKKLSKLGYFITRHKLEKTLEKFARLLALGRILFLLVKIIYDLFI